MMAAELAPTTEGLEPLDKAQHVPEEIVAGLAAMAVNGGDSEKACNQLHAHGINLHPRTLRHWRHRYPNRYAKACEEHAPAIEATVLHLHREIASQAAEGVLKAIRIENRRLDYGKVDNAARSAKDLSTAAAIAVDKVHAITGRPTSIHEHRTVDESLNRLARLGIIDGTAQEEPQKSRSAPDIPALPCVTNEQPREDPSS